MLTFWAIDLHMTCGSELVEVCLGLYGVKVWPNLSLYLTVRRFDKKRQLGDEDTMLLVFEGPDSTFGRALLNASIVLVPTSLSEVFIADVPQEFS